MTVGSWATAVSHLAEGVAATSMYTAEHTHYYTLCFVGLSMMPFVFILRHCMTKSEYIVYKPYIIVYEPGSIAKGKNVNWKYKTSTLKKNQFCDL